MSVHRIITALVFTLFAPLQAQADDWCEELWILRNMAFDRSGYCFSSPLGSAVFNNDGCAGNVTLGPSDQDYVDEIRTMEQVAGCAVDTNASRLSAHGTDLLRAFQQIDDLPILSDGESACLGYRGGALTIHTGPSMAGDVIGTVTAGQNIGFAYQPVGQWEFVTVLAPNTSVVVARGWIDSSSIRPATCTSVAG
jgi:hypothetical protein